MNQVFALQGAGTTGKTTTIKCIFDLLKEKYPKSEVTDLRPGTYDIKVLIDINGTLVGIESQGDPNSNLETSLPELVKNKCDIIICACRTRGMTTDWIGKIKGYKINFVSQTISKSNRKVVNNNTAVRIIEMAGL
ncbi:MAG: hypothetical protein V7785_09320 [Bermanella sp.]